MEDNENNNNNNNNNNNKNNIILPKLFSTNENQIRKWINEISWLIRLDENEDITTRLLLKNISGPVMLRINPELDELMDKTPNELMEYLKKIFLTTSTEISEAVKLFKTRMSNETLDEYINKNLERINGVFPETINDRRFK